MIKKLKYILIGLGILGVCYFGAGEKNEVSLEKLQTKYDASTEIKAKYVLEGASLKKTDIKNPELDKYKGEPKDEVKVTLGDKDATEFKPNIELKRWNEVSFKIKTDKLLEGVATKDRELEIEGNKIKFKTPDIEFEMEDFDEGEGSYKFIWYLNEKPATNKVEFEIESSGLDFFYQPPLTQEYQNGYSEEFGKEIVVTETQVKDLEGNVLVERPENVVGSYAVYHSTKGGMVDGAGKDYKTGKAFHIYRPHIIDAEGKETWGILHIENGIYSVEIPQEFLDTAVYPIKSNDTFGYTTAGASRAGQTANEMVLCVRDTSVLNNGTVTSISAHVSDIVWKGVVTNSSLALLSNGVTNSETAPAGSNTWRTVNFSISPNVTTGNSFYPGLIIQTTRSTDARSYDSGSGVEKYVDSTNSYTTPEDATGATSSSYPPSIYATYTPAGGGGTAPLPVIIIIDALPTLNNNYA